MSHTRIPKSGGIMEFREFLEKRVFGGIPEVVCVLILANAASSNSENGTNNSRPFEDKLWCLAVIAFVQEGAWRKVIYAYSTAFSIRCKLLGLVAEVYRRRTRRSFRHATAGFRSQDEPIPGYWWERGLFAMDLKLDCGFSTNNKCVYQSSSSDDRLIFEISLWFSFCAHS
ncbi:hypothetical protein CEXT_562071 [Caerostris extrusa]|uniref:Uncharacterized protein n=1 Tax=Caerostris extrusa TaxID=172846 RepID=A0AAV4XY11_CAEEX|nr:hypothetical protein CEXT_562071 [Caerostris extrusa]